MGRSHNAADDGRPSIVSCLWPCNIYMDHPGPPGPSSDYGLNAHLYCLGPLHTISPLPVRDGPTNPRTCSAVLPPVQGSTDTVLAPVQGCTDTVVARRTQACRRALWFQKRTWCRQTASSVPSKEPTEDSPGTPKKNDRHGKVFDRRTQL